MHEPSTVALSSSKANIKFAAVNISLGSWNRLYVYNELIPLRFTHYLYVYVSYISPIHICNVRSILRIDLLFVYGAHSSSFASLAGSYTSIKASKAAGKLGDTTIHYSESRSRMQLRFSYRLNLFHIHDIFA